MLRDARTAKEGAVLPEVYASGEVLWVGQLTQRVNPDMDTFTDEKAMAETGSMPPMRQFMERSSAMNVPFNARA